MDSSQPLDPRKTIFVGGVPRPLRAGKSFIRLPMHSKSGLFGGVWPGLGLKDGK